MITKNNPKYSAIKQEIIEKVFGSKIINSELALEGIVSRIIQIDPPLTKALSN